MNKSIKIGIVGQGYVGTALKEGIKSCFLIETFDILKDSTCNSLQSLSEKSNIIFLCLPTPMEPDGKCHLNILEETLLGLDIINKCNIIVIKSTIPPGTTEKWNRKYKNLKIVFNPEFLTEANALEDYKNQNRIIVGGPRPATTQVKKVFSKAFPKVPIIKTGSTIAEMVKYLTNCFLATKVSFANEIYQICRKLEIDYDKVVEYAKYDERLGYSHWDVPGPDGDLGFGGHCFPKDLSALIYEANKQGLGENINLLKSTKKTNDQVRKNRDWEKQKGRAVI